MKNVIKIGEMAEHCPTWLKDAFVHVAKDAGLKTDSLELHRHTHSEKSATGDVVGGPKLKARQSLKYVSARTQDRDDEIVIPSQINLKEFRKYAHVLVNHNYRLLPVGSDEMIEADDYGIKALTNHADTGEGTLANVIWHLVDQGHMKASSIGFVPTSFTKPGARDWDHVANQLQTNWKEFDKGRAEKSISRIITGGVLLEHSFVSVPCNSDAGMIQVMKSMDVADRVCKQLGFDPSVIVKGGSTAVPCVCDECGKEANAQPGDPCPDGKCEGSMKSKADEKAYNIRVVQKADGTVVKGEPAGEGETVGSDEGGGYASGSEDCKCSKCGVERKCEAGCDCAEEGCDGKMQAKAEKGISNKGDAPGHEFHGNQHTGGGSGGGRDVSTSRRTQAVGRAQDRAWNATDRANRTFVGEGASRAHTQAADAHEAAAKITREHADALKESGADKAKVADLKETAGYHADQARQHRRDAKEIDRDYGKGFVFEPEVKVIAPAPSVKVLFVPSSEESVKINVANIVREAMARHTGKLL